jgi:hypothetical protein
MGRLKFAELLVSAISAIVTAAKYIIKLIDCLGRIIRKTPASSTA